MPPQHRNHAGKTVAKSNFVTLGLKISIWCMAMGLGWMECIFAVPVRIAAFNLYQGVEDPGSAAYEATRAILQRVNADIVGVVEANGATQSNFSALAASLGYAHTYYSPQGPMDTTLRTAVMSRWPITYTDAVQSPPGAKEMTRANGIVVVDVPGTTQDPTLVVVHYKCCATYGAESFRRAIEIRRTVEALQNLGKGGSSNVFVIGDFNLVGSSPVSFDGLPSTGLPGTYQLGSDVSFPVSYQTNPDFFFSGIGMGKASMLQADGDPRTFNTGGVLDYIVTSQAVLNRGFQAEIYNSAKDAGYAGLQKSGSPLPTSTSSTASDHYLIFGDFQMDDASPLETWITGFGLTGSLAELGADPDGDGLNNAGEYAFGTSPVDASSRPVTQSRVTGGIKITYLQRSGVTYAVKSATDLAVGFTGVVIPLKSVSQPTGLPSGYEQYEATLTIGTQGFLKVEATVP